MLFSNDLDYLSRFLWWFSLGPMSSQLRDCSMGHTSLTQTSSLLISAPFRTSPWIFRTDTTLSGADFCNYLLLVANWRRTEGDCWHLDRLLVCYPWCQWCLWSSEELNLLWFAAIGVLFFARELGCFGKEWEGSTTGGCPDSFPALRSLDLIHFATLDF